jgi:hypothetical protein
MGFGFPRDDPVDGGLGKVEASLGVNEFAHRLAKMNPTRQTVMNRLLPWGVLRVTLAIFSLIHSLALRLSA